MRSQRQAGFDAHLLPARVFRVPLLIRMLIGVERPAAFG
jgi:hypothetical protein